MKEIKKGDLFYKNCLCVITKVERKEFIMYYKHKVKQSVNGKFVEC